jgi:hypothetical protein
MEAQMVQDVIPQDIDKAWKYYEHADNLYASRVNFFLVAESMVVVAYVTLQGSEKLLRISIAILGLLYTYIWFDVNLRLAIRMTFLDQKFLPHDKIYDQYTKSVSTGCPSRFFLTYVLPIPRGPRKPGTASEPY